MRNLRGLLRIISLEVIVVFCQNKPLPSCHRQSQKKFGGLFRRENTKSRHKQWQSSWNREVLEELLEHLRNVLMRRLKVSCTAPAQPLPVTNSNRLSIRIFLSKPVRVNDTDRSPTLIHRSTPAPVSNIDWSFTSIPPSQTEPFSVASFADSESPVAHQVRL